jgi:gamma-glutamylcyclotransferase
MNSVCYFAYGSNMLRRRLQARVQSVDFCGVAVLSGYALAFHKVSKDGSGKCDVISSTGGSVYGALFKVNEADLLKLDEYEGNGKGYERRAVQVHELSGGIVDAHAYMATNIDPTLRPYTWYKRHVLEGAQDVGLPDAYLQIIRSAEAIEDPDIRRAARELAIYN